VWLLWVASSRSLIPKAAMTGRSLLALNQMQSSHRCPCAPIVAFFLARKLELD
jgi:hypothetical protein